MNFRKVYNKDGTMFLVHSDLDDCLSHHGIQNDKCFVKRKKPLIMHSNLTRNRKDRAMSNSIYYKAMDEDGNIILRHSYNKPNKKKQFEFEANGRRARRNSAFVKQRQDQQKSQFEANAKRQEDPFANAKSNAAFVKQKQEQQKKQLEANGRAKRNAAFVKKKQDQQKKQFEVNAKRQEDLRALTKYAKEADDNLRAKRNAAFVKKKQDQQKKQFEANAKRQEDLRALTKHAKETDVRKKAKEASEAFNKVKKAGKDYLKRLTK